LQAPELFQPDGCHSACSDLYALGCCLYECLAGRPPFVSTSFTELVNAVLYEPPPPLPQSTSHHLVHLVMGLLAKDPRERLQVSCRLTPPPFVDRWV
jgi:serine/threonine-protein kinase ULK4